MILKTLWIQRKCNYEGQIAPECLCCISEYNYSDYPEWFDKECAKELNKVKDDIYSHKIIDIVVEQDQISKLLNKNAVIKGEIKNG